MGGKNSLSFLRDGPDPSFGWHKLPEGLRINSLRWQGTSWAHDVWVRGEGDTCLLFITGDLVPEADGPVLEQICVEAQMPVAMLFGIPNQPLWDMREDDLIAFSFEKWLETGDREWPVVFAMARAVLRTMDALEAAFGFRRFVLAGGSKRGWTAWLASLCGDDRVIGVCPMVFDNLDMPKQMAAQIAHWGAFSPKLDDYTRRQLQGMLDSEEGLALAQLVDPLSYLDALQCPLHLINGSNDEFWVSDATSNYWDRLPEPKSLSVVPNAGHNLGDGSLAYQSLGAFARRCAHGQRLPQLRASVNHDGFHVTSDVPVSKMTMWMAESPDLYFHDKVWSPRPVELPRSTQNVAYFVEAEYSAPDAFRLSTVPQILRLGANLGNDDASDTTSDVE